MFFHGNGYQEAIHFHGRFSYFRELPTFDLHDEISVNFHLSPVHDMVMVRAHANAKHITTYQEWKKLFHHHN